MSHSLTKKLYRLSSSQFGFDPRRAFRSLGGLLSFVRDLHAFKKGYTGEFSWMPCLHDRHEEGGATRNEYFWQDLLVAQKIHASNPRRHVDIGSRVDGFVAHVASFREIEVFDVRPITTSVPGVVFERADLMKDGGLPSGDGGYCDSLSCLHALEHFGLGRYGDPVNPEGHAKGIANMSSLLESGGIFYLSTPIGRERVEFNAHRVFDPRTIIRLTENAGMQLRELSVIGADGQLLHVETSPVALKALSLQDYNLGLFIFSKM